jgi:hypothetical protein
MKRKISSLRPLIPVATFGLLTVSAQPFTPTKVMLLPSESPNRLRGSFRMAFNVKTSFENVGAFTSSPPQTTPNGDAFNYDDGYVLTDSSGNMMGYTRYWGYTSGSQLPGNGTILMNRYSSGGSTVGGHNDEMLPGFELTYRRELGQGEKLRWGLEASGNYMHVSVSDSRTVSAGATRFTDTYALPALEGGGFVSPPPPPYYQGPDLPPGGSIVIGATPVSSSMNTMSSSVSGSRHFESEVIGFRLGPYVEMPLGRNGKLSLSGGLSLAQVLSDFDFNESSLHEMRRLFLGGHDVDLGIFLKPAPRFQPALHIAFGKAQPAIAIKFPGFVELVREQIENQDLSRGASNFGGSCQGRGGIVGVMQRLAENHQVNARGFDRRVLQIAEAEFQILQTVLLRLRRAELDDLFRVVHCDDFLAAPREQFAQQAFARAEVGHGDLRQHAQEQVAERLPRAARAIDAIKASGDLVEENFRLLAAAIQDALEIDLVAGLIAAVPSRP